MTHDHSIQVLELRLKQLKNLVTDEIARTQSLLSSISESNFTSQHHIDAIKELTGTIEMLRNPATPAELIKKLRKKVDEE